MIEAIDKTFISFSGAARPGRRAKGGYPHLLLKILKQLSPILEKNLSNFLRIREKIHFKTLFSQFLPFSKIPPPAFTSSRCL